MIRVMPQVTIMLAPLKVTHSNGNISDTEHMRGAHLSLMTTCIGFDFLSQTGHFFWDITNTVVQGVVLLAKTKSNIIFRQAIINNSWSGTIVATHFLHFSPKIITPLINKIFTHASETSKLVILFEVSNCTMIFCTRRASDIGHSTSDSKFANGNKRQHTATDGKQQTKIQEERKKREVLFREIEYVEATQKQCMYECRENSVEIVFNAEKDEEEGETCDDDREVMQSLYGSYGDDDEEEEEEEEGAMLRLCAVYTVAEVNEGRRHTTFCL
ncbi:hypothetical protein CAPTEDRAFT_216129 [Capitella teleta]|uniref:Uncharacterized protein n=1 Tax=Capitella teleta TaxID=283909 RepID=R7UBS1_CAPTE|nr:hypothetical protein CAPTEDRAFT_216129 [Capitella teleta]|eukprot:ELU01253.1 hypothetical protein CAPTEDRAFT_216129 [Capitella teleta]